MHELAGGKNIMKKMKKFLLTLDIQTFAEDAPVESNEATNEEVNDQTDKEEKQESQGDALTKEYIEKLIQSEVDRVRGKYAKELKAKEKELENFRTASMTAQEKAEYEVQQLKEDLEKREQDLLQKEMKGIATDLLSESNLDLKFVDFVTGSDVEDTKARTTKFKDTFNKALEKAVEERFKAAGRDVHLGNNSGGGFTREQVATMSTAEINRNWGAIQTSMKGWKK
jgi:hypothetical protein